MTQHIDLSFVGWVGGRGVRAGWEAGKRGTRWPVNLRCSSFRRGCPECLVCSARRSRGRSGFEAAEAWAEGLLPARTYGSLVSLYFC